MIWRIVLCVGMIGCAKEKPCAFESVVVHAFPCKGNVCEVIVNDGAIVRVSKDFAHVGAKICD